MTDTKKADTVDCDCPGQPCIHTDRVEKLIEALAGDLEQIWEDLGWNYALGWDAPTVPAVDTARRGPAPAPFCECVIHPCEHTDRLPGAKRDPGVGAHACRHAVVTATGEIARGAQDLSRALAVFEPDAELVITVPKDAGLAARRFVVKLAQVRVNELARRLLPLDEHHRPAGATAGVASAYRRIHGAAGLLVVALAGLDRAPATVDTASAPMCAICEIRPRHPKKGKRCSTCDHYFYSHNRKERPRSLDRAVVEEAERAQAARRARGEGWGAA